MLSDTRGGADRRRLTRKLWLGWVCLLLLGTPFACSAGAKNEPSATPTEFQAGEGKFKANCARCHGERGVGTAMGPPLVHKIYEPNHHADMAFQMAAARGVKAHHWNFGDMPRIESVNPDDVTQIVAYVRWLQRQAGIQ